MAELNHETIVSHKLGELGAVTTVAVSRGVTIGAG